MNAAPLAHIRIFDRGDIQARSKKGTEKYLLCLFKEVSLI